MRDRPANDGLLSAALRWARAVGRRATEIYQPRPTSERDSMEHLVQAGFVHQHEPGKYYLDEAAVNDWMSDRR